MDTYVLVALSKCLNANSPRPPMPHTMYCCVLSGSMGLSHAASPEGGEGGREGGREGGSSKSMTFTYNWERIYI